MKNKSIKKFIALALSAAMALTGSLAGITGADLAGSGTADAGTVTAEAKSVTEVSGPTTSTVDGVEVVTWDLVEFGNYPQSDSTGATTEPIQWRVLSVDGNDAFLLADKILDCKPYNNEDTSVTWETCTLRKWLNGLEGNVYTDSFINKAFTETEQSAIISTTATNDNNPYSNTEGGADTTDKIYLLSISEGLNSNYGFNTDYSVYDKARQATVTAYASEQGCWVSSSTSYAGNGNWWLRSPGDGTGDAAYVDDDGYLGLGGDFANDGSYGVRPALHVNLTSSSLSYVGTVTSTGTYTDSSDSSSSASDETTTDYTVSFNLNGASGSISSQTVTAGSTATKPSDPARDVYTFTGWYTDSACTSAYDFSTAVTSNTIIYAGWKENAAYSRLHPQQPQPTTALPPAH